MSTTPENDGATCDLAIVGTGSLARHTAYSLPAFAGGADGPTVRVAILGRSVERAAEVAYLANTRAGISERRLRFAAYPWKRDQSGSVARLLGRMRPRVVVNCASLQSPWEASQARTGWTGLLAEAGFGLGLPLQAVLAAELATAVRDSGVPTRFVNASFPDGVNPLLAARGLPVLCGIGNVATLSASLHAALDVPPGELRVLAHHSHLHAPARPEDEVLAWHGDRPVPNVGTLLAAQRTASRQELNAVTGHEAARLLAGLLAGERLRLNLPGPLGLPGGYPVSLDAAGIALDLPPDMTRPEAVGWQLRMAEADGVSVDERGTVAFSSRVLDALARRAPELSRRMTGKLEAGEMPELADRLLALRTDLRTQPAP